MAELLNYMGWLVYWDFDFSSVPSLAINGVYSGSYWESKFSLLRENYLLIHIFLQRDKYKES